MEKIASSLTQSPIIPKAIQSNLFRNLAWDNKIIDRFRGDANKGRNDSLSKRYYSPASIVWSTPSYCSRRYRDGTGFNIQAPNDKEITKEIVGYLPTINAPATEMKTVNEILSKLEEIRKVLNLKEIVVVMDQALYAKAAEIKWQHPNTYSSIILRLGTFHTICNLMSIIGKRFEDAGLKDLCIESGVIAERSIQNVLTGKMSNRGVRVHKCIYYALMRLACKQFAL